jgi:hypothetical protein
VKTTDSVLFTVQTPYPARPTVTLTHDTWYTHIQVHRPALKERPQWLQASASAPTAVCAGGTDAPGNICFVNQGITTGSGAPLVVFVNEEGLIDTAGFRHDFADLSKKTVLWMPPK